MKAQRLLAKRTVNAQEINQLLSLRKVAEVQRRRLEMATATLEAVEEDLMSRIEAGATVISVHEVEIKLIERRNVGWKQVASEALGHEAVEKILNDTVPTITRRLLVSDKKVA